MARCTLPSALLCCASLLLWVGTPVYSWITITNESPLEGVPACDVHCEGVFFSPPIPVTIFFKTGKDRTCDSVYDGIKVQTQACADSNCTGAPTDSWEPLGNEGVATLTKICKPAMYFFKDYTAVGLLEADGLLEATNSSSNSSLRWRIQAKDPIWTTEEFDIGSFLPSIFAQSFSLAVLIGISSICQLVCCCAACAVCMTAQQETSGPQAEMAAPAHSSPMMQQQQ